MPFKTYAFLIAAVVLTAFLAREQSQGTFDRVNETYREWLAANSGGGTANSPPGATVFLSLSENEKNDFEGWPLTRLDFAVLAQNLARFGPRVLAVQPSLAWDAEDEFTGGVLRAQLESLPAVVLGYPLALDKDGGTDPADGGALPDHIPAVDSVKGDLSPLPSARFEHDPPEATVVPPGASLGFTGEADGTTPPLLARCGDRVVPSLPLQTVATALGRDTPKLHAVLGSRVQLRNAGNASVPVNAQGQLSLPISDTANPPVVHLHAGTLLLTGQPDVVLDNLPPDQRRALNSLKDAIVVLGYDGPDDAAKKTATTVSAIIARIAATPAPPTAEFLLWAVLILAGAALMSHSRSRIVFGFIALTVAFMAGGLLVFQGTQRWVSPTIPLALIAATLVWGFAVPIRKKTHPVANNE